MTTAEVFKFCSARLLNAGISPVRVLASPWSRPGLAHIFCDAHNTGLAGGGLLGELVLPLNGLGYSPELCQSCFLVPIQ